MVNDLVQASVQGWVSMLVLFGHRAVFNNIDDNILLVRRNHYHFVNVMLTSLCIQK